MTDILVTTTAQQQLAALDDVTAEVVESAIQTIDRRTGELIDLPGAPAGTSYLALPTRVSQDSPASPVIVYRPCLPSEDGDWLVLSLLTPDQYRALRRAEKVVAVEPAYRQIVAGVVGGTVPSIQPVNPETAAPMGGAMPTVGADIPDRRS